MVSKKLGHCGRVVTYNNMKCRNPSPNFGVQLLRITAAGKTKKKLVIVGTGAAVASH